MKKLFPIAVGLLVLATGPAVAKAEGYFVAQDSNTKVCKITKKKPDGAELVMIGDKSYPTKEEARTAKRASDECPKGKKPESNS